MSQPRQGSAVATRTTIRRPFRSHGLERILALLTATLLFSACVDVEIGSEYLLDGSATHSIQIVISREPDERVTPAEINRFLDALEQQSSDAGLEFIRSDTQNSTAMRILGTTSDGEDAGAAINGLINATGLNTSPGVTAPFRGTFARETGAVGGTAYTLDLSVDGQMLFDSVAETVNDEQEAALRETLTMHYEATVPGDVTETGGELLDEGTVRWQIPLSGEINLLATSRTGGSGSAALFIILGIVAMIAVILIAAGLGWYIARRKRLSNALGGPLHRLPGQRTITTEGAWVAARISGLTRRLSRSKADKSGDEV